MFELAAAYAREKVGLVFYRVYRRAEPFASVGVDDSPRVVPGGRQVKLAAPALLEISEFYQ